ncbi:MAG: molecular chaperone HtpG [Oscillospiraceae bacterium]|nr:molecular chaperone HtpG [Oscillospiraceae bacterium]
MAKKQFKAESKRLMDLMINSIYTHREIFLREIISNASDALDRLAYRSLTDDAVEVKREDLQIILVADKAGRTLTVSDNGIGMTKEELEHNLGTIAKSGSLQFKQDMDAEKAQGQVDVIGQFGVGFYSAFMVADKVTVLSRAYGSDEAWQWESSGADGYTVTPCDKATPGTNIIMHIKLDGEECAYSEYLESYRLAELVRKYSDYVHFPIRMEMEHSKEKERPADAGEDYKPEWETVKEWETLNSMVPLWQRSKSEVSEEEYNEFYKEKFGDWENPLSVIHTSAEGMVSYKALLYLPAKAPYDFYSQNYEKGLQLYSSGVLIMDKCADLLPDHFRFVRGVVDSPDFSLNLSREMLQHDRQLKVIANALEKKIKAELLRLQKDQREQYETFWEAFGHNIKYGIVSEYGAHRDMLKDLLLFWSSKEDKQTTLAEYQQRMPASQQYLYYVRADSVEKAARLPQVERIRDAGFEILYLTEEVDEFVVNALGELDGKQFKAAADADALPQTDEEKAALDKSAEENKDVLDFVKETLGDKVSQVRLSSILKSAPVCLTADGPVSLEMERYFQRTKQEGEGLKAQRVLELNANSGVFAALRQAVEEDREKAASYAKLLYAQALLLADLPLEDPAEYTQLVCQLMV